MGDLIKTLVALGPFKYQGPYWHFLHVYNTVLHWWPPYASTIHFTAFLFVFLQRRLGSASPGLRSFWSINWFNFTWYLNHSSKHIYVLPRTPPIVLSSYGCSTIHRRQPLHLLANSFLFSCLIWGWIFRWEFLSLNKSLEKGRTSGSLYSYAFLYLNLSGELLMGSKSILKKIFWVWNLNKSILYYD